MFRWIYDAFRKFCDQWSRKKITETTTMAHGPQSASLVPFYEKEKVVLKRHHPRQTKAKTAWRQRRQMTKRLRMIRQRRGQNLRSGLVA